jgi:hypothetical protein
MNQHDDHLLDARMRDVPVPAGIADRVASEALFDDAAIDRLLVRVALPPGLQDRIRQVTDAMRAGGPLPLPHATQPSRQAGPSGHRGGLPASFRRWMRLWPAAMDLLADAGAVAAALSIVALMFFAGTELSRRLAAPPTLVQPRGAVRGTVAERPGSAGGNSRVQRAQPHADNAAESAGAAPSGTDIAGGLRSPADVAAPVTDAATRVPHVHALGPKVPATDLEVRAAPAAPVVAGGDRGAVAAGMRTVLLPPVGRQVPRVTGYDIAFEMAHGESPFVDPSVAAKLAVDRPPLSLRTDSFDSLCESARRDGDRPIGRRPRRGGMPSVRTEDILAALPAPPEDGGWSGAGPGLSLNAVRSLRPAPGSMLVEVCATAPPLESGGTEAQSAPLDVMLVLDQSAGPFASLSWQWLCRGLGRVIGQMRRADRVSLVICGERPRLVALRADAATLATLLPELMREPVATSADFDAAFRLVAAVGRREGRPHRIVAAAHTDTLERCRKEARAALSAWQAELAAATTSPAVPTTAFVLIDPQESLSAGGSLSRTRPLTAGTVAADPAAVGRGLMEQVFGRPTLAATGCRLEVAFDPGRVGSYRIVGHRQTAADALASVDPRGIDLHAGETVRVVYEVVSRPVGEVVSRPVGEVVSRPVGEVVSRPGVNGPFLPGVVTASLAWTPAGAGPDGPHPEQMVRKVLADATTTSADLRVGLPSPHGCELLLAVALGELTSASVHAEPWRQSAAGIAALASRWRARGDVTPIGAQLIDCLENQGIISDAAGR